MSVNVFCDASVNNKKQMAVLGAIIRHKNEIIHKNQCVVENVSGGSYHGELLAIEMTVNLLKELNMSQVKVFTDCQSAVYRLRNQLKKGAKHRKRIEKIKEKAKELELEFHWIPRERNKTVDKLTRI